MYVSRDMLGTGLLTDGEFTLGKKVEYVRCRDSLQLKSISGISCYPAWSH